MRLIIVVMTTMLLGSGIFAANNSQAADDYHSLWGTTEVYKSGLKEFPKWAGIVDETERILSSCGDDHRKRIACVAGKTRLGRTIKRKLIRARDAIEWVNKLQQGVSAAKYVDEITGDSWLTSLELFKRGGDCEDFALAKWMFLVALGVDPNTMRVVIIDMEGYGIYHAILVLYTSKGVLVLDNRALGVMTLEEAERKFPYYRIMYSLGPNGWWKHKRGEVEELPTASR